MIHIHHSPKLKDLIALLFAFHSQNKRNGKIFLHIIWPKFYLQFTSVIGGRFSVHNRGTREKKFYKIICT